MKVIVTRPRAQAQPLVGRLEGLGYEVVECPLIEIVRTSDEPIDCAGYEWAVITSPNGADEVARRARNLPAKVAAVGPGTAETLRRHGIEPTFVATTTRRPPAPARATRWAASRTTSSTVGPSGSGSTCRSASATATRWSGPPG